MDLSIGHLKLDNTMNHLFLNIVDYYWIIMLITNIFLFYVIYLFLNFSFHVKKNRSHIKNKNYLYPATFIITQFLGSFLVQTTAVQFGFSTNIIGVKLFVWLSAQFLISTVILGNKKLLNSVIKLIFMIFLILNMIIIFLSLNVILQFYISNDIVINLWMVIILVISGVIGLYFLEARSESIHKYAFYLLLFLLVIIANEEQKPKYSCSLLLQTILKIIKILCLLDFLLLIKNIIKTIIIMWVFSRKTKKLFLECLIIIIFERLKLISTTVGLEKLPNKFLKNEINGWIGILQE